MENIKASTVFQVQWFANSENYNAAASVISQGKRVFQQVNDSFRRDTVLADTIPMLRISHNARIKTKSLVGIGVNTFSIGGIGTRCTASTNARTRFRNRNAFGTYPFETKGELFVLYLSFLGWDLLSLLTLGILEIVYVAPYKAAAVAGFYDAIKGE